MRYTLEKQYKIIFIFPHHTCVPVIYCRPCQRVVASRPATLGHRHEPERDEMSVSLFFFVPLFWFKLTYPFLQ